MLWKWELLSLVGSAASFVAIIIILRVNEDKTLSSWEPPISINAVVAILSAVFKASLGLPISEGLSQLKWLWFSSKHRSLSDMDMYDKASRGPWGSVLFISKQFVRRQRSYLASLGAFVAVITLATDPFSQAAVSLYSCNRPHSSPAGIPMATNYTISGGHTGIHQAGLDVAMQHAIYSGLLQPPNSSAASVSVVCPTGNCTFPADNGATFNTLAMCHSCKDISDTIQKGKEQWDGYTLPGGAHIDTNKMFNVAAIPIRPSKESYPDGPWKQTSFLTIQGLAKVETDPKCPFKAFCVPGPIAFECSLRPCVKTFAANLSNNIYYEEELSRQYMHSLPNNSEYQLAVSRTMHNGAWKVCQSTEEKSENNTIQAFSPDSQWLPGTASPPANYSSVWYPQECVYTLGGGTKLGLQDFVGSLFDNGTVKIDTDPSAVGGSFWLQTLWKAGRMNMTTINKDMEGLVTAISGHMRAHADGPDSLRIVTGQTLALETCVRVQWGFLAFPATVLVLEMLFVTAVVAASYCNSWKADWKSSSLALVFQNVGNPEPGSKEDEAFESEQYLSEAAERMRVVFAEVQGRWRLLRDGTISG